jgi:hypothetical protein
VAAAKSFTAGESHLHPLRPEWDPAFLDLLAAGDITAADGMTNSAITRNGGKAAHEIHTWIAAFGSLARRMGLRSITTGLSPNGSRASARCMHNPKLSNQFTWDQSKETFKSNEKTVLALAASLRNAEYERQPVAPVRGEIPPEDVALASAVQRARVDARCAEGELAVVRKIGLTSVAVQRQLGVDQPTSVRSSHPWPTATTRRCRSRA